VTAPDQAAPKPSGGANLYITTCIHGADLRFTPRCWLCRPEGHQHRFDVVIQDDAHSRLLGCSNTPCHEVYQWDK
jgi:hypothetical protein